MISVVIKTMLVQRRKAYQQDLRGCVNPTFLRLRSGQALSAVEGVNSGEKVS